MKLITNFCFVILLICFSVLPVNANYSMDNDVISASKTLEERDEKNAWNINFSIPSGELQEKKKIDLVFIMDSTSIANYQSIKTNINEFLEELVDVSTIDASIGVVKFSLDINRSGLSMKSLTSTTLNEVKSMFNLSASAGSNMYGAILAGEELLNMGSADLENKYLIVASDFGGFKSDTGDGKGLSFFYNYSWGNQGVAALHNNIEGKDFGPRYLNADPSLFTVDTIDQLINNRRLFSGTTVSDETEKYLVKTGPEAGEFPDSWRNPYAHYGIINHNWTTEEKSFLVPDYNFTTRSDFPTSFEKNIFLSGNKLKDIKDGGINVMALTSPYQNGNEAWKKSFNLASNAFKDWFELNIGTRYESTKNESMVTLLDDLETSLVYLLGKGTITDVIAENFSFISNTEIVLSNGIELDKHYISENSTGFGEEINGSYQYVFEYKIINDEEIIFWHINDKVKSSDNLEFKFGISLKKIPTTVGANSLDTNRQASLDYMNSKEVDEGITEYTNSMDFPSPFIIINIGSVTVYYVDTDGNELSSKLYITKEIGDTYSTESKTLNNYELVATEGSTSGTFVDGNLNIKYIYKDIRPIEPPKDPLKPVKPVEPPKDTAKPVEPVKPPTKPVGTLPQTGIESNTLMYGGILIISGLFLVINRKKSCKND